MPSAPMLPPTRKSNEATVRRMLLHPRDEIVGIAIVLVIHATEDAKEPVSVFRYERSA